MKLTTAGESHGKALVAIIEGLPSHLAIDIEKINDDLALRQSGYGRGARQKIEKDCVEILTGVRNSETLGSPVTLCIYNKDYKNWETCMSDGACDALVMDAKKLEILMTAADLGSFTKASEVVGYTQSGLTHMMDSLEREIGFPLLQRNHSGIQLTEQGALSLGESPVFFGGFPLPLVPSERGHKDLTATSLRGVELDE